MLHTDDVDQKYEKQRYIDLFIRKNRYGILGKINYTYYGDYSEFVEKQFDKDTREWVESNYDVTKEYESVLGDI